MRHTVGRPRARHSTQCDHAHTPPADTPILSNALPSAVPAAMKPITQPALAHPRSPTAGRLARMLLLCVAAPATALAGGEGEISFVIGQVRITNAAGTVRTAETGSNVAAGDRIETGPSGHVHLRMVDGGYLSVRPGSRFVVEQYETAPGATAIRLRLDEGVVRSITGAAARENKDRFRLNTPLAAIGVRGTDFVVQAGAEGVRALVNEGTIVVAPLGADCTAHTLGPCSSGSARELSDTMGRVLLELKGLQAPQLVPVDGKSPDDAAPPAPQEPGTRKTPPVAAEAAIANPAAGEALGPSLRPQPVPPPARLIPGTHPADVTQLRWGRWADARADDQLSTAAADAREGRRVTVGNNYVNLYRRPDDTRPLPAHLGQVGFGLAAGQVALIQANGATSAGAVHGGRLDVDFAQRSFATRLDVSHALTGAVHIESAGNITSNGTFFVNRPDGLVAGAVTMDGTEAGYLFDKSVPQGILSGTTLWKR